MAHPLKFGYKASAEQFAPNELLNFAIEAEQRGSARWARAPSAS